MIRRLGCASVALAIGAATPSAAAVIELGRALSWAAHGGVRADGRTVCALVTGSLDGNGGKLTIKHVSGSSAISIRLDKPSWRIPPGTKANAMLRFSGNRQIDFEMQGAGTTLEQKTPSVSLDVVAVALHGGPRASIAFAAGSEKPWPLDMTGEHLVEPEFLKCIREQAPAKPETAPTQPF